MDSIPGGLSTRRRGGPNAATLLYFQTPAPAAARTASASTVNPAVAQSSVILSASLWLIPPWQGQNSSAVGTSRAIYTASCPIPVGMSLNL